MEIFELIKNDFTAFNKVIKSFSENNILSQRFKVWENFEHLNLIEYAISIGNLKAVKSIMARLRELGITFTHSNLAIELLKVTLQLLELTSYESLQKVAVYDDWNEVDQWEDVAEDEEANNVQFEAILKILDYLLKEKIMKYTGDSNLILLGATINLFDGELRILRKMLPFYTKNLRTEYEFPKERTSLMHLAIANASVPLFKLLLESGYELYDFSYSSYNPLFEIYRQMMTAKLQKDTKYQFYDSMFNLVFKGNKSAYDRAIAEFYLILKNQFDFSDTLALNKLPNVAEIATFRGYNNQTLLSVSKTEDVADAVLGIKEIDPMALIPLADGVLGIAIQYVPLDAMRPILETMNAEDIKSAIPWFIENKEIERFHLAGLYIYNKDPEDIFLETQNLLQLGLSESQIEKFKQYIRTELGKSECALCGNLTNEFIQCGHKAHHACLAKSTNIHCPYCRQEYILPEPYHARKIALIQNEKKVLEDKWRVGYGRLLELYGDNIPADELYKLTTEFGI
jgi:hypothetical protein